MSNTGTGRWRQLVAPATLALLAGGETRLFEVGFGALPAFLSGHIPGAAYLDTAEMERPPLWNRVDDATLLALLLRHGVRHDSTVILYGRNQLAAARAAHLMLYLGVADVRLLDGGFDGWRALGGAVETGPGRLYPGAASFGTAVPAQAGYLLDMDAVRRLRRDDPGALVSVRTWPEYQGHTSGYSYISARGDIPGARWGRLRNDDDINGMSEFHRDDGCMAHPEQIRRIWRDAGMDPVRHAVFYCGTGWRASLAFFYAWLMGWEQIAVYDGGWCEWSRDLSNPVLCRAGSAGSSAVFNTPVRSSK